MQITKKIIEKTITLIVEDCYRLLLSTSNIENILEHYNDANSKINAIHLLCSNTGAPLWMHNDVATWIDEARKNIHVAYINANTRVFTNRSNTFELMSDNTFSLRSVKPSCIDINGVDTDRYAEILNYLLIL